MPPEGVYLVITLTIAGSDASIKAFKKKKKKWRNKKIKDLGNIQAQSQSLLLILFSFCRSPFTFLAVFKRNILLLPLTTFEDKVKSIKERAVQENNCKTYI